MEMLMLLLGIIVFVVFILAINPFSTSDEEKRKKELIAEWDEAFLEAGIEYENIQNKRGMLIEALKKDLENIENGETPKNYELLRKKASPIQLKEDERYEYAIDGVAWEESRKVRSSVSYGHLKQRIKIAKGLSYTIGNVQPVVHSEDEIQKLDRGTLHITDKRLILIGNEVRKIDITKIADYQIFSNAFKVLRESGKPVYFGDMSKKDMLIAKALLDSYTGRIYDDSEDNE